MARKRERGGTLPDHRRAVVTPLVTAGATRHDPSRWVQTLRAECLDHVLVLGEMHLWHLVTEFVTHSNEERSHQARGNVPLPDADRDAPRILPFPTGEVECTERLGGLRKHCHRAA